MLFFVLSIFVLTIQLSVTQKKDETLIEKIDLIEDLTFNSISQFNSPVIYIKECIIENIRVNYWGSDPKLTLI
jgi:hypothetical protein